MDELYYYRLGMKRGGGSGGGGNTPSGGDFPIGDGNTHIWISLAEGRTSPMLGVAVNGTVTVDWGDGTTPDVLTGTSTSTLIHTPKHEYAKPGSYVITLTVEGRVNIYGDSSRCYLLREAENATRQRDAAYISTIKKIEVGNNTACGNGAFCYCYSLTDVYINSNLISNVANALFLNCSALKNVEIAGNITRIYSECFDGCKSLVIAYIPDAATMIGEKAFRYCEAMQEAFVPSDVATISANAFAYCNGMKWYDFTKHTSVPTLAATNAFSSIPADCEIRVPAALVDTWKAATNWSTYADYIVGV